MLCPVQLCGDPDLVRGVPRNGGREHSHQTSGGGGEGAQQRAATGALPHHQGKEVSLAAAVMSVPLIHKVNRGTHTVHSQSEQSNGSFTK